MYLYVLYILFILTTKYTVTCAQYKHYRVHLQFTCIYNSYKNVLTSSRFPVRIHHKNMNCLHRIQISKKNIDVIDLIDNWISCLLKTGNTVV